MTWTRTNGSARTSGGSRTRRSALAVIIVATAGLAAPPAHAGEYSVWSCRGPDGAPLSAAAFKPGSLNAAAGDVVVTDSCASGGALTLSLTAGRAFASPALGTATLAAPPGTRIIGFDVWRSLAVAPPRLLGNDYDFGAAVTEDANRYGCATFAAGCHASGDPTDPLSDANHRSDHQSPLGAVGLAVWCDWSACGEPPGTPARVDLYRARVDLEDVAPPAPPALGGTLAGRGTVSGTGTLSVAATDQGAGVRSISLAIDGGPVQPLFAACPEPYTSPQPCPLTFKQTFTVQTGGLADGAHTATGTVVDAAGNVREWSLRFTTQRTTVGGGPEQALRLRFADARVEHRPGRAARLRGWLRTQAGAPVGGARLEVTSTDRGVDDARPIARTPVTTRADGSFAIVLRRDGAQRVTVAYAPRPGVIAAQASATVRSKLALRVARSHRLLVKGRSVTLRGRLTGAGASARGALVQIQAIVNGDWTPVGSARVRRDGSFRWRYRFVHLQRDTIFAFRGVVEHVPGWPWPSTRSDRVTVRVDVP